MGCPLLIGGLPPAQHHPAKALPPAVHEPGADLLHREHAPVLSLPVVAEQAARCFHGGLVAGERGVQVRVVGLDLLRRQAPCPDITFPAHVSISPWARPRISTQ